MEISELPRPLVIAVDGPSGSGKSSVSREVARRLGLEYLDTGAMYRAATWSVLEAGVDLADQAAVAQAVRDLDLRMGTDPAAPGVHVGSTDVAGPIRETRISSQVSAVATNLEVRAELKRRQRELIEGARDGVRSGVVAEGRDITTVVAPDADVRILLTASEEARLARRARELHGAAEAHHLEATRDQVLRRDRDDATVSSFHVAADGVLQLDSSELDFEQTVQAVLQAIAATVGTRQGDPVSR
ncbi:(d)CMP kinase [Spongisporangium articulatum]|uniref:Cytidylate kinase n=1 Tax=Spongisporangium articulatum TaxID=3362603 RepID=A0ABW8AUM0_9ACTN